MHLVHLAIDADRLEAFLGQQIVQELHMVPGGCEDEGGAPIWDHLLKQPQQRARLVFLPAKLSSKSFFTHQIEIVAMCAGSINMHEAQRYETNVRQEGIACRHEVSHLTHAKQSSRSGESFVSASSRTNAGFFSPAWAASNVREQETSHQVYIYPMLHVNISAGTKALSRGSATACRTCAGELCQSGRQRGAEEKSLPGVSHPAQDGPQLVGKTHLEELIRLIEDTVLHAL